MSNIKQKALDVALGIITVALLLWVLTMVLGCKKETTTTTDSATYLIEFSNKGGKEQTQEHGYAPCFPVVEAKRGDRLFMLVKGPDSVEAIISIRYSTHTKVIHSVKGLWQVATSITLNP